MKRFLEYFKRKIKVDFYFKSGNQMSVSFTKFEISKLSGNDEELKMSYGGQSKTFTVDLDELECVIINN